MYYVATQMMWITQTWPVKCQCSVKMFSFIFVILFELLIIFDVLYLYMFVSKTNHRRSFNRSVIHPVLGCIHVLFTGSPAGCRHAPPSVSRRSASWLWSVCALGGKWCNSTWLTLCVASSQFSLCCVICSPRYTHTHTHTHTHTPPQAHNS